ncbi:MAG: LeuA family protein [Desulfocucumaceae bacterium]
MKGEPWETDQWLTSQMNFLPEVREALSLPKKISVHDATLRDGEQTPGVVFRREEKVRIAQLLAELGVDRIEAGMPAVSREDYEAIKEIVNLKLPVKVMGFCRAMPSDIDKVAECGADGIILEIASGDPKIKHQFKWSEEKIIEKSIAAIKYAKESGLYVTYFPFDTTRARLPFLERLLKEVMNASPPDSIAVVDTTGSIIPRAMHYLVKFVKDIVNVPVEVHTHNDFGMGTATTLAAVEAGAEVVHVCANGLGERCGNTSLDEVVIALKTLYNYEMPGIKFEKLYSVAEEIAEIARMPISPNKAVVGPLAFTREIGLGMETLKTAPLAIFPFLPSFVGQDMRIVLGKKSGKESIRMKLNELNIKADDSQVDEMLVRVKDKGTQEKRCLTPDEFDQIVKGVLL